MAAEFVDIHGKLMFLHALSFNKFEKWSVTIAPTAESLEVIRDLQAQGVKNVMKKDENNTYFISFNRDPTKLIRGKVVAFAAPKVVDKLGQPYTGGVGRDSDVTVRLDVYQHGTPSGGKSKAARFDSIRIDNLVPYEIDRDLPPSEAEAVKDLVNAPAPLW